MVGGVDALLDEQLADQPLTGDHAVRAQEEQREQRPLLRPADRHRPAIDANHERSQDPELEATRHREPRSSSSSDFCTRGRDTNGTALGHDRGMVERCCTPRSASGPAQRSAPSADQSPQRARRRRPSSTARSICRGMSSCSGSSGARPGSTRGGQASSPACRVSASSSPSGSEASRNHQQRKEGRRHETSPRRRRAAARGERVARRGEDPVRRAVGRVFLDLAGGRHRCTGR